MAITSYLLACTLPFIPLLLLLSLFLARKNGAKLVPPGPAKLPIIGNLHQLGKLPHRSLFHLSQKHGPLMHIQLGSIPAVVASTAEIARELLKANDLKCCSRPSRLTAFARLSYDFSDVAFCPYTEQWRELRKILLLELLSPKKVATFGSIREEELEQMISSVSRQSIADVPVNLSEALSVLSNSVTCRIVLGSGELVKDGTIHRILGETSAMLGGFFFADYIPMLGWLDILTGMRARLEKNFQDHEELYRRAISVHESPSERSDNQMEDAVDMLLRMRKNGILADEHVKGLLMNLLVAGSDTTSATIEWAMAELMKHTRAMRKAQEEVRGLVGQKGKVEESDLVQLRYLKCVVKETLRLHPPGPLLLPRETSQDFRINGYDIPANTWVLVNAWATARERDHWEMPDEFRPERFEDGRVDFKGHDSQLIPFGSGRRICPGIHFGVAVVELTLANLLYCFDWELPRGMTKEGMDMDETFGIVMHKKSALHLLATRA